jgi:photoactive yellow protein
MQFFTFGADDTANAFARLSEQELGSISFGVIQVDETGRILIFNAAESSIAGIARKAALGKNFFTEVAICTNESGFRGRFEAGVKAGTLDILFEWHLAGENMPRVVVHITKAARGNRYWICTKRL